MTGYSARPQRSLEGRTEPLTSLSIDGHFSKKRKIVHDGSDDLNAIKTDHDNASQSSCTLSACSQPQALPSYDSDSVHSPDRTLGTDLTFEQSVSSRLVSLTRQITRYRRCLIDQNKCISDLEKRQVEMQDTIDALEAKVEELEDNATAMQDVYDEKFRAQKEHDDDMQQALYDQEAELDTQRVDIQELSDYTGYTEADREDSHEAE